MKPEDSNPDTYREPEATNGAVPVGPVEPSRLSARRLAANRANARKSTGPRTEAGKQRVSQNHLQHGAYARRARETMILLEEEPEELDRLYHELLSPYEPAHPLLDRQIKDLAHLYWDLARWERTRDARLRRELLRVEYDRIRRRLRLRQDLMEDPSDEIYKKGARRLADSPAKFKEVLECLGLLFEKFRERRFTPYPAATMETLYGEKPNPRGLLICSLFEKLAEEQEADPKAFQEVEAHEAVSDAPGPHVETSDEHSSPLPSDPPPQAAADEENEGEEGQDAAHLEMLERALNEEQIEVVCTYKLYLQEYGDISIAERDSRLAPDRHSLWFERQGNQLQRAIDRKTQTIMSLTAQLLKLGLWSGPVNHSVSAGSPGGANGDDAPFDSPSRSDPETPDPPLAAVVRTRPAVTQHRRPGSPKACATTPKKCGSNPRSPLESIKRLGSKPFSKPFQSHHEPVRAPRAGYGRSGFSDP